jgi:hypothetical protein
MFMSNEIPVMLSEAERKFLLSLLIKLPIQVTLENINGNKTIEEMTTLVRKLQLKSEGADATIIPEEE